MYDLASFRNNLDAIAARLADRGFTLDVENFRRLDVERRAALTESEQLKARRNAESKEIGLERVDLQVLKSAGGLEPAEIQQRMQKIETHQRKVREIGDRAAALETRANELD